MEEADESGEEVEAGHALNPRLRSRETVARLTTALLTAIVMAPAFAGVIGRGNDHWIPDLDNASITHRVQRLLEGHWPRLGMPSTLQGIVIGPTLTTNHPGPIQFGLLAPAYAASGERGLGIALGSAVLNALVVLTMVVLAHRRRGPAFAAVVAVGVLLLERSMTTDLLADPFNPYASILPLAALGLITWSAAAGDRVAYVPLGIVSAFVAQAHLSGTVPGLALLTIGGVGAIWSEFGAPTWRQWRNTDEHAEQRSAPRRGRWRHLAGGGLIVFLLWLPVAIDQVAGTHNLSNLWSATQGRGAAVGSRFALRVIGRAVGIPPAFAIGPHRGTVYAVGLPLASVLLGVIVIVAALAWSVRRHWYGETAYMGIVLFGLMLCGIQTARLPASTFNEAPYAFTVWHVRYWLLSLSAALWIGVAWIIVRACTELIRSSATSPSMAPSPFAGGLAVLLVVAITAVILPPRRAVWHEGEAQQSRLVRQLADGLAEHLDRDSTYLAQVNVYDAATIGGAMTELRSRGFHLVVPNDTAYYWGPGSACRRGSVDQVISFRRDEQTTDPVPAGLTSVARAQGSSTASARMDRLYNDLDEALRVQGGVRYHAGPAGRFLAAFPGEVTDAKRIELLPTFANGLANTLDVISLLELDDAGVLDEPGLAPLLDRIERAGARFFGALGPESRFEAILGPPDDLASMCS